MRTKYTLVDNQGNPITKEHNWHPIPRQDVPTKLVAVAHHDSWVEMTLMVINLDPPSEDLPVGNASS